MAPVEVSQRRSRNASGLSVSSSARPVRSSCFVDDGAVVVELDVVAVRQHDPGVGQGVVGGVVVDDDVDGRLRQCTTLG